MFDISVTLSITIITSTKEYSFRDTYIAFSINLIETILRTSPVLITMRKINGDGVRVKQNIFLTVGVVFTGAFII